MPTPPQLLSPEYYPSVEERMLGLTPINPISYEGSINPSESFTHYMQLFSAKDVDIFLFTANSAIPVADAVRRYCTVMGVDTPQLEYVLAHSYMARMHPNSYSYKAYVETESSRLKRLISGGRVAVIDQYVNEGLTLRMAQSMTVAAGGIMLGGTENARWYGRANTTDPEQSLISMSSEHCEFMSRIGQLAAEQTT